MGKTLKLFLFDSEHAECLRCRNQPCCLICRLLAERYEEYCADPRKIPTIL